MSVHTTIKLLVLNLLHLVRITFYVAARKTKFSKERSSVRNLLPYTLSYKQLVCLDSSELEILSLLGCPSYIHLLAEANSVTYRVVPQKEVHWLSQLGSVLTHRACDHISYEADV